MKRINAITFCIILLTSFLIPYSASAQVFAGESSGVISVRMGAFPAKTNYNAPLTFTVVTDANTSKVKITRGNGNIFALANSENGFSDYTDNGGQRTWIITRNLQLMEPDDFIISAGNSSFEYSGNVKSVLKDGTVIDGMPSGGETENEITLDGRLVEMFGAGWNLGNSLDSHGEWIQQWTSNLPSDYETAWNNPVTTKAMIDTIAAKGFKTLRVPTTWYQHIDENGIIDPVWMARVREVVDYGIENGMFVILNIHHEDSWITVDGSKDLGTMKAQLTNVWTQIANEFGGYDRHLVFEVMNEPRNYECTDEWTGNAASYERINELNATALAAIRATGGKNAGRFVLLPTYAASAGDAPLNAMSVPDDPCIIISVHAYTPYNFCTDAAAEYTTSVENELVRLFSRLSAFRTAHRDVPVIIGEYGCHVKNDQNNRRLWVDKYTQLAEAADIPCVFWDNNASAEYILFNRSELTWTDSEYAEIAINNLK